jgi:Uma2 family endonuclease
MKDEETPNKENAPFTESGRYTYADYLTWEIDERVELIKGKVFRFGIVAPLRIHQTISGRIAVKLFTFLKGKTPEVYMAPFDVRLPNNSLRDEDIDTVVQPDICVFCDLTKLDDLGGIGAPDLIIEILAPGNNKKELQDKYDLYKEFGVKEYWIIHPNEQTFFTYTLVDGNYIPSKLFTSGDIITSRSLPGFKLDLEEVFMELD